MVASLPSTGPDRARNTFAPRIWQAGRFRLALDRPRVMGIVNVTPDSFSDGGRHATAEAACAHCERLLAEGADILDIGGESTRPGSKAPGRAEELARVVPVLRHAVGLGVAVSVDTSDPEVMQAALALGADILNDVRALRAPGALELAAAHPSAGVCLMHMRGLDPGTMQLDTSYEDDDVVAAVTGFLEERRAAALSAGIAPERIVLDPGIGFGKSTHQNLALSAAQPALASLGSPLLLGWSRKGILGRLNGRPAGERVVSSVAAALAAVAQGALILRVHDVAETVDALKVWHALVTGSAAWPA
jgi:dihydropteroate synthase